jgi:hypothetical protein
METLKIITSAGISDGLKGYEKLPKMKGYAMFCYGDVLLRRRFVTGDILLQEIFCYGDVLCETFCMKTFC